MLSITTDYVKSEGDPEPYLRQIADAGFSHVHWCHEWNTDYLYSSADIDRIGSLFSSYDLSLLDIHASHGRKKDWGSVQDDVRQSGVTLIKNRMDMAAALGSDVIVLHLPPLSEDRSARLTAVRASLDTLSHHSAECGVKVAIENMPNDDFSCIRDLLDSYEPDFLGLCYDSGHGNMGEGLGLGYLEECRDRLLALHLHDNDGTGDHHNLIFSGTVDWKRLTEVIAKSSYSKCVSMELSMRMSRIKDEQAFLEQSLEDGETLTQMIAQSRSSATS